MNISNIDPVQSLLKSWQKIKIFVILILFCIGLLQISALNQIVSFALFIVTFIVMSALNVITNFHLISQNRFLKSAQLIFEILFYAIIIHYTGGMGSSFVWIFILAIISATLVFDNFGGIITSMLGSISLLALMLLYNYDLIKPIDTIMISQNIASQTIFFISYFTFFSIIGFITEHIVSLIKMNRTQTENSNKVETIKNNKIAAIDKDLEKKYKEVVTVATSLSTLDHDINNPLTIISLSISRILNAGRQYNDEKLMKYANQMTKALTNINNILDRVHKLKELELIEKERRINDEKTNPNS